MVFTLTRLSLEHPPSRPRRTGSFPTFPQLEGQDRREGRGMLGARGDRTWCLGLKQGSKARLFVGCPAPAFSQICKLPPSSLRDLTRGQSTLATVPAMPCPLNYLPSSQVSALLHRDGLCCSVGPCLPPRPGGQGQLHLPGSSAS